MTWGKAIPALVIAVIFDVARIFFEFFWFFGPALIGVYCAAKVGDVAVIGGILATGCAAGATAIGIGGFAVAATFGSVMAMATGFAGWLVVGGWLMATNARIFKENALWFVGSLLVSEIPLVGSIPAITIAVWRMYSTQIKKEKAAFKKWEEKNAGAQLEERNQQIAQLQRIQAEAANDAAYAEAANDEQYEIPEDEKMAA
jgi:hypothetical protein